MTTWTAGYVAEIDYTHGYYAELNPLRLKLAFLANGLAFPEVGAACELGFGQGVSTNMHAAASQVSWWGTDFNPSQAGFAQELGAISGAKVYDEAFAEFCNRPDLPDFDFIALHGIWTWISDENRAVIVDFVRRKLKVGGVLYISYNTLPGWSTAAPLRHLFTEHKAKMGGSGLGMLSQVDSALNFTQKLLDAEPIWSRLNPQVVNRFKETILPQNRHYLAHEYFNRDWHPMYFADMADHLAPAKLSFASSAHVSDLIDAINLTAAHQALLKDITDPDFKQTVRDYLVSQQFRKDYWVKGPRRLNPVERAEQLRALSVVLTTPRAEVTLKAKGVLGEADLAPAVYNPILDILADHQVHTIAGLEQALQGNGVNLSQLQQAIIILVGQGHLSPAHDAKTLATVKPKAHPLNQLLLDKARGSGEVTVLASPVTGGGVGVGRFHQLFLLGLSQGHKTPEAQAKFAWEILAMQGQRIVHDGKTLETPDENIAHLTNQAREFGNKYLPILKALAVVD